MIFLGPKLEGLFPEIMTWIAVPMRQPGYAQGKFTGAHGFVKDTVRTSVSMITHMGRDPEFTTVRQADLFADQTSRSITRGMTQCFNSICTPQWDNPHFNAGYRTGYLNTEVAAFLAMDGANFVKGAASLFSRVAVNAENLALRSFGVPKKSMFQSSQGTSNFLRTPFSEASSAGITPKKFFGNRTYSEMQDLLKAKFGQPRPGAPGGMSFFNQKTGRTFHVHQHPHHMRGKPHVDIRRRGPFDEKKYYLKEEG